MLQKKTYRLTNFNTNIIQKLSNYKNTINKFEVNNLVYINKIYGQS